MGLTVMALLGMMRKSFVRLLTKQVLLAKRLPVFRLAIKWELNATCGMHM